MQVRAVTLTFNFENWATKGAQMTAPFMRSLVNNACCNLADEAYLICAGAGYIDCKIIENQDGKKVAWVIEVHALINEKIRGKLAAIYDNVYTKTYKLPDLVPENTYENFEINEKIEYVLLHSSAFNDAIDGNVFVSVDFDDKLHGLESYEALNSAFVEEKMRVFDFRRLLRKPEYKTLKFSRNLFGIEIPFFKKNED